MRTSLRMMLTVLLCLMLFLCLPTACFAEENGDDVSGSFGQNLFWNIDDRGTLYISGSGKMTDFESAELTPWYSLRGRIQSAIIMPGITNIGDRSFSECYVMSSVNIPSSVTVIGNNAFSGCRSLHIVGLLENVEIVGSSAFSNCTWLSEVDIPVSLRIIGENAFAGCSAIEDIYYPGSKQQWESIIFADGNSYLLNAPIHYNNIVASGTCGDYGDNLTWELYKSGSLVIDGIGGMASWYRDTGNNNLFNNPMAPWHSKYLCPLITEITLRKGVTSIGSFAFQDCYNLNKVTISDTVKVIEYGAFWGSSFETITIPTSVTAIGEDAFAYCSNLTDIYYAGNETQWNMVEIDVGGGIGENIAIHFDNDNYTNNGIIDNSGDESWVIELSSSFENCVLQTPSTVYNPTLSYYLAGLSRAVYNEKDIIGSLRNLGFDCNHIIKELDYSDSRLLSGYVITKKSLDDNSDLVLIAIRGSVDHNWLNLLDIEDSWAGNGHFPALDNDANEILSELDHYLNGLPTSNTVYVITGHSQGAGAGNLLAMKLCQHGIPTSIVYDYNFACPNTACYNDGSRWNPSGIFNNIFNIGNADDIVSVVPSNFIHKLNSVSWIFSPTSTWGKYGRSYWFCPDMNNRALVGHDMIYYLRALAAQKPISEFVRWDQLGRNTLVGRLWKIVAGFCPVNMTVYNADNIPIAGITDNQINYYDSEFGDVLIFVEGDEKWFYLPPDQEYHVEVIATDEGSMDYKVFDYSLTETDVSNEKSFDSIKLTLGKTMTSLIGNTIPNSDIKLYVVDKNANPISEVNEDGTESPIFTIHGSPYKKGSDASPVYASNSQQVVYDFDSFALSSSPEETSPQKLTILDYHIQSISATDPSGNMISAERSVYLEKSFLDTLPAGTYYLWGITGTENTLIGSFAVEVADNVIATVNGVECATVAEINAAVKDADDPVISVIPGRTIPVEQSNSQESDLGYVTIVPAPGYDFPEHESSNRLYISKDAVLDLNGGTVCGATVYASNLLIRDSSGGEGRATAPFILNDLIKVGGDSRLASLTVTGGSFVSDFNVSQYLAPGYAVENADGWDHVVPISYTISYDANGGSGAPESQMKTHGRALMLTDHIPNRSGWYFLGWAENSNAIEPDHSRPGGTFTRDADTVLYAVWAQPDLVLPSAVTAIGVEAFTGGAFRFASLPENAVSIGSRAFADCPNLRYIYIYDNVTDIAMDAFSDEEPLTIFGVGLPNGEKSAAQVYAEAHGFTFIPVVFRTQFSVIDH